MIRLYHSCKLMTPEPSIRQKRCRLIQRSNENLLTKQRMPRSQKGQARRWPVDPPGSNTRFCPDFVSMILGQKRACWLSILQKMLQYEPDWIEVLKFVFSVEQNQRGGWSKVVLVAVEVLPVRSKLPAAFGVCISKSERHDFSAAAPLSTKMSSLQERAGDSAFTP